MIIVNYIGAVLLIVIGFYAIVTRTNLLKLILGLNIVDYGVNLLIVSVGFNPGGTAPIFTSTELHPGSFFVDPVPQALTLTSIVIGACVTALTLALAIKMKDEYGTLDTREIRRLRG